MDRTLRGLPGAVAALAVLLVSTTAFAYGAGAEVTLATYRSHVEPICKAYDARAPSQPGGGETKQGRRETAQYFWRTGVDIKIMWRKLKSVRQPRADRAVLTRWLDRIDGLVPPLKEASRAVSHEKYKQARILVKRIGIDSSRASQAVERFHFGYC
jgi:hypothetical protein